MGFAWSAKPGLEDKICMMIHRQIYEKKDQLFVGLNVRDESMFIFIDQLRFQSGRKVREQIDMANNEGSNGLVFFASILSKMSQMFSEINSIYLQAMMDKKNIQQVPQFNINQLFTEFENEEKNKEVDLDGLEDLLESENEEKAEVPNQSPKRPKKEPKKNKIVQQKDIKDDKQPTIQPPHPPPSSYLIFFNEHRSKITEEFPNLNVTEQSKIASKCWRELTEQEKKPYHDRFNQEKKKYYQELKVYNELKGNDLNPKKKQPNKQKAPKNEKKPATAAKGQKQQGKPIPRKDQPRQQNSQSSELSSSMTV